MKDVVGQVSVLVAAVFAAGCCYQPVGQGDGGGTAGSSESSGGASTSSSTSGSSSGSGTGSSSSGSTGGSTGGSSGVASGLPTESQLCTWAWQGLARADLLAVDSLAAATLRPPSGPYCPTPTPAQENAIAFVNDYIVMEAQNLPAPDGGWPDGSGPTVCDDPSSPEAQFSAAIEGSLVAGRAVWNAANAATCAQGMQQSQYLLAAVASDGGTYPGAADVGAMDGGPCVEILQGQIAQGGACMFGFDCQAGLYCRPNGASACSGVCAVPLADRQPCGVYDQCVAGDSCENGTCAASGTSTSGSGPGAPGTPCSSSSDCQPCLNCNFGMDGGACAAQGLFDAGCTSDTDCAMPLLYCNGGKCQPAGVTGQTGCMPSSDNACLFGWCEPALGGSGACVNRSDVGGPCFDDHSCSSGYCAGADAGVLGSCTGEPGAGQPCHASSCDNNLYCDGAGTCQPTLPAGAACTSGLACQSGSCVNAQCASPCITGCGSNCTDGPGASLLLGLGGAAAIGRRRRRRKH